MQISAQAGPPLTADQRKQLYGQVYDEIYRCVPHHPMLTRKMSPAERQVVVSEQMDFLTRFIGKDITYLEVGAGDCALTFEDARRVRKAIGVEVSAEIPLKDRRPENFELILSDGTSIPVPAGSVDVVYSNHLMEHLHPEDVHTQLINLNRALKPGGVYLCLTPNRLTGPHDTRWRPASTSMSTPTWNYSICFAASGSNH
jgi:SAM-dependent methyltransferase